MGGDQQRVELRLFLPPTMSLAILRTFELSKHDYGTYFCAITNSLNLLNLASHPSDLLLNQQNKGSEYASAPRFVPHAFLIAF
jgi:hypothetical protein